jgi:hypothetical protein
VTDVNIQDKVLFRSSSTAISSYQSFYQMSHCKSPFLHLFPTSIKYFSVY